MTGPKIQRRRGQRPASKGSIFDGHWKLSQVISLGFLGLMLAFSILGSTLGERPLLTQVGSPTSVP